MVGDAGDAGHGNGVVLGLAALVPGAHRSTRVTIPSVSMVTVMWLP
jgi:hypothetical protein